MTVSDFQPFLERTAMILIPVYVIPVRKLSVKQLFQACKACQGLYSKKEMDDLTIACWLSSTTCYLRPVFWTVLRSVLGEPDRGTTKTCKTMVSR